MAISTTTERLTHEGAAYGGLVDAVGGIATVVLTIVGLASERPDIMLSIATIVFGAALLIEGGSIVTEYAQITVAPTVQLGSSGEFGGNLAALFPAGVTGIVLGILALLGIHSLILVSIAVIVFGTALILSANSVHSLHALKRAAAPGPALASGSDVLVEQMSTGTGASQALAGVAVVVLGILAVAGAYSLTLSLIALLVAGAALIMTGSTMSMTLIGMTSGRSSEQV